jgi:hypothetical protein
MKRVGLTALTAMALAGLTTSLQAHHSLAGYDQTTLVPIKGVVSKIDWINPHAWITLTVRSADGKNVTQRIQIAAPKALMQRGLDKATFKIGDEVTFEAWMPKDDKATGVPNGRNLILGDGRRFDVGDNFSKNASRIQR